MTPEKVIEVSIKARLRAKEMLKESGDQPQSFTEYQMLVEQCQDDIIEEMENEQDNTSVACN